MTDRDYSTCGREYCKNPRNGKLTQDDYYTTKQRSGSIVTLKGCKFCQMEQAKYRGRFSNSSTVPVFGSLTPKEYMQMPTDPKRVQDFLLGRHL